MQFRFFPAVAALGSLASLIGPIGACSSDSGSNSRTPEASAGLPAGGVPQSEGGRSGDEPQASGGTVVSAGGAAGNDSGNQGSPPGGSVVGGSSGTGGSQGRGGAPAAGAPPQGGGPHAGGGAGNSGPGLGNFSCPPPPYAASPVTSGATAQRLEGVPPSDAFITDPDDLIILEGPVWLNGALYLSEIENGPLFGVPGGGLGGGFGGRSGMGTGGASSTTPPPSRVLKVTETGAVSVVLPDAGTNGLALDPTGGLIGCNHKTGSVTRFSVEGAAPVDLVSMYMASRFNSPNDLTFGADGSLYFTDPNYQAPSPSPQSETRVYRVAPGTSSAVPLVEGVRQPNGITFSPDRKTLYVSSSGGISAHPVMADGSVGPATRFGQSLSGSDGMAVDCAGNLYTTSNQSVVIVSPAGMEVGRISVPGVQSATNVAFGGPDHKTIYITAQGTDFSAGLFKVAGAIPGMPY